MCVTRVALPEKPGKVSFVCIVGRAVLYCDGCGLAVWPYITGHSKTELYGEYSTGGAFESPTQSTCNSVVYVVVEGLVLGQSLMVISTMVSCCMQKYLPFIMYYGSALLLFTRKVHCLQIPWQVTAHWVIGPYLGTKFQTCISYGF